MRLVRGAVEARQTLLARAPLEARDLPPSVREEIRRVFGAELDAEAVVERVLRDVREEGDAAVLRYNEDIDGIHGSLTGISLEVSKGEIEAAVAEVEPSLLEALRQAAERIRAFHERQLAHSLRSFSEGGLGQVVRPLARVGLYVPGTAAVYPSTVLMTAIPARVAGVSEVIMATPAREDAGVSAVKLAAAAVAGVDRVFRAGGVQGIAAMAYGTETVPRVDKVCGPGNIFVTLAKQKLYGQVGIDGLFGPSETLVIADEAADPSLVAADLLAGAEHDELATAVLITTSERLAAAVTAEVKKQVKTLERASIANGSLEARGGAVLVDSLAEAVALANEFAPEHLCLHVANAGALLEGVRNAGCVFVGGASAESIGDYTAGPSHVMPTGGSAAYASPLGVHDFLKVTSVVDLDADTARRVGAPAAAIARAEGLTGHARAIERRLGGGRKR
ncbi:MAG TPA: histidinol dehydrogenase [Dehalococcoidia bacterium]|nr:histidinol dehydrogenase [Dehalococcoidia bacterium]